MTFAKIFCVFIVTGVTGILLLYFIDVLPEKSLGYWKAKQSLSINLKYNTEK
jgi:hypothetical protein